MLHLRILRISPLSLPLLLLVLLISCQVSFAQVLSHQKISDTNGGFPPGLLSPGDQFGAVTSIGDLDGDGVVDLAVGVNDDNDGGKANGAVWIVFLNADGTVKDQQKISELSGGLITMLDNLDSFGISVASLGDIDNDPDTALALAVGAIGDDDMGGDRGAVYILFLDTAGLVVDEVKIRDNLSGFMGPLDNSDEFGCSLASLGDLDGDGVPELAVGSRGDDDGGLDVGAFWILFLNENGTVSSQRKISATAPEGCFPGVLQVEDGFGLSLAFLGDLDQNDPNSSTALLAVQANRDDGDPNDPNTIDRGAVWILDLDLSLGNEGKVLSAQKINEVEGGFTGTLDNQDRWGKVAAIGDIDGDGVGDLAVGSSAGDDGGSGRGEAWIVFLYPDSTVKGQYKISDLVGGFAGILDDGDNFGNSVTGLGDLNGDGMLDIAVSAGGDDDGGESKGAVWILFLCSAGLGAVNSGTGAITPVLTVNGGTGVVSVATGADITVSLAASPAGPLTNVS